MAFQSIIITIGDELLIGQTIDTNAAWIAKQLNAQGINVLRRYTVADEKSEILNALELAIKDADLILLTGGLGPTADDITKPALNEYFGGSMVVNETVLQHIKQIFAKRNKPFLDKNRKQAEVPDVAQILFNSMGTAPGMWFEKDDTIIISMPGVPFEMQDILQAEALPRIAERLKGAEIFHRTIITVGVGESFIAEKISDIEAALPAEIHLAYLPSPGLVKLRLTSSGTNREELTRAVLVRSKLIEDRLGDIVAAVEDIELEEILVRLLKEHRMTLGLAESCTGGYIAHRITNVAGSSEVLKGSIVSYSNKVKETILGVTQDTLQTVGAVSEETVLQMAKQAREVLDVDIALSVSGILGPGGATTEKPVGLVWMAVATANETFARSFNFHYDRVRNKEMAAHAAMNLVREVLNRL